MTERNAMRPTLGQTAQRNAMYAMPGPYQTFLQPHEETAFRQWVSQNGVPFDPMQADQDYDMRGFWKALQSGDPSVATAVNANDGRMHYPDTFKTPMHQTFSAESRYALPVAPQWIDDSRLADPSGRIIFDERQR